MGSASMRGSRVLAPQALRRLAAIDGRAAPMRQAQQPLDGGAVSSLARPASPPDSRS